MNLIVNSITRCKWCVGDELYERYHDEEWGVPVHDEQKHFEFLLLETMQAGLSWITILRKRENYRVAFANFIPELVANYTSQDIEQLMQNSGIIRNHKKLEAAVTNAQQFLAIQDEFGSFDRFIWSFTNNQTIKNSWQSVAEITPTTELSDRVTKELKRRGFKFVGSTTIYSHLQAIGIINDHVIDCFRYNQV